MPFIAIALAVSIFLGGSAFAAATPEGHAALDNATKVSADLWSTVEAGVTGHDSAEDMSAQSSGTSHGALRIRDDADAEAQAADDRANDANINADGSLKANVDGSVHVNIY